MENNDLKWAFFSYGHNLGDFTRALETAKGMKNTGTRVKFFNHGGVHNHMIRSAGIDEKDLSPELSWEQHKIIMDINRYKAKVGTPLPVSTQQWIKMAEADLEAMEEFQPDGVYAGLNLSCMISIPYAKLPMVTQVPTVNCPAFIQKELYNMPNTMERNFFMRRILPSRIKRKIMKRVLLKDAAKASLTTFNEARKHFGQAPIYNITDIVRGDITILPDMPVLSGLEEKDLDPGYYYSGPIFSQMNLPVPEEVKSVFSQSGLNIFCSFGSSGFPETLKKIIKALQQLENCNIICSTTTILDPKELGPNTDRFFATRFLPAHLINEMANVAVLHGGQGTIQTAAWAGTPVVGIGFQAEQQANIDGLVHAGTAIRIPIYDVSTKRILKAVKKVSQEKYIKNASQLKDQVRSINGVEKTVEIMNDFVLGRLKN
ncbi:glycosyltransferase [Echinicola jeungdonensis]|uniref:Glycosyltransferase n=1 Tax=Echinicola jeungdonensis TaxID=709343 RepID=A0ABV5J2Y5_9BACT|nr:nucleotide disphospho-sugar-binding domain-containing protein [Echinicola jeungdonensis]MDN3671044.1 glycosyltransferase [Echinicola jeungdonensis]